MDRKSVLVVDDDPAILRTVGRALDLQGYHVMTAGNGSAALHVAQEREPSLIVLDLAMPVLDGCAFLASYHPAVPVIVISGRQPDGAWRSSQSVVGFVPKPFDLDDLLGMVERQLQGMGPRGDEIDETAVLLLRIAVERDVTSFERLYDQHSAMAFGLCLRLTSDRMWAEDTVQEAFLSVWQKAHLYDPSKATGRQWLLAVVHHQAVDRLRRLGRQPAAGHALEDVSALAAGTDVWAEVEARLDGERVRRALAGLPARSGR